MLLSFQGIPYNCPSSQFQCVCLRDNDFLECSDKQFWKGCVTLSSTTRRRVEERMEISSNTRSVFAGTLGKGCSFFCFFGRDFLFGVQILVEE